MIDDDDATWAVALWPEGGGWIVAFIGVAVVVILLLVADGNRRDCEARRCDHGRPRLMSHECVCVEEPLDESPDRLDRDRAK